MQSRMVGPGLAERVVDPVRGVAETAIISAVIPAILSTIFSTVRAAFASVAGVI